MSLISSRIEYLKKPMFMLMIFTLICIVLNIGMVRLQKEILDNYMTGAVPDVTPEGITILFIYVLALAAYFFYSVAKTSLVNRSSRNISAVSGSRLFKKIFDQPLLFFEQYSAGELMARIDNTISLDNSIIRSLVPRAIDAVMTIVYLVTLMGYNYIMATACFVVLVINLFFTLKR